MGWMDDELEEIAEEERVDHATVYNPAELTYEGTVPENAESYQVPLADPWECGHENSLCAGCLPYWSKKYIIEIPAHAAHRVTGGA